MSLTHLPTDHPEPQPASMPTQVIDDGRAVVTHHHMGALLLDGWTHTALDGSPYTKVVGKHHVNRDDATVTAMYVGPMGWDDSDEIVPAFVSIHVEADDPAHGPTETVTFLSVDQATRLHDALSLALTEHDFR